jgi:toxin ParE1/3/4
VDSVTISVRAEADLDSIVEYSKEKWGSRQTDKYLSRLEDELELLARNPLIGRSCNSILPGLRRLEVGKHVVFYVPTPEGILISRVLHRRMLPAKSRFEA